MMYCNYKNIYIAFIFIKYKHIYIYIYIYEVCTSLPLQEDDASREIGCRRSHPNRALWSGGPQWRRGSHEGVVIIVTSNVSLMSDGRFFGILSTFGPEDVTSYMVRGSGNYHEGKERSCPVRRYFFELSPTPAPLMQKAEIYGGLPEVSRCSCPAVILDQHSTTYAIPFINMPKLVFCSGIQAKKRNEKKIKEVIPTAIWRTIPPALNPSSAALYKVDPGGSCLSALPCDATWN